MCFGHSHPTDVYSLADLPSLVLWCAEMRTRLESEAQWCTYFGWKIWALIFFLSKKLTTKKQTLMTNLQSFFSISSLTPEARSNAVVSWLVTWKDSLSLRKGGCRNLSVFSHFFKKKTDNKEKETDARSSTSPPGSSVSSERQSHA